MTWWCSTVEWPWTWEWRPYVGAWLLVLVMTVPYLRSMRRRAKTVGLTDRDKRAIVWYLLGIVAIWVASDWPVAALSASYLLTMHTAQFILYGMLAAPLLLIGMPEWMIRRFLERTRLYRAYRMAANVFVAAIVYNGVLILTHVPNLLDGLRASQLGSFVLDIAWLIAGLIVWTPVVSTISELRLRGAIARCTFLFLATGVIPMIPAALITFSPEPSYATYELAPRSWDFTALEDQQLAGAVMKVTGIFITFPVIAYIFIQASLAESRHVGTRDEGGSAQGPAAAA